jgi:small subunit ribosomal protein S3Ae
MAVGKNKKLNKGKKGSKKKYDIFSKKEWYDVKAPAYFKQRDIGKAVVSKSQGMKMAADGLTGRVYDICLADLNDDESTHRKIKLVAEDVQGKRVLTNFHGMDFTTDKLRSLVKKWQSLIEAFVDVKSTDGYVLRIFVIGFTKKTKFQIRKTSYAQSAQIKRIRAKMVEIVEREAKSCDLRELVNKFIPESISKEIEKSCQSVYPMHDVYIRKVKVLKKPKFDVARLLEIHGDSGIVTTTADGQTVKTGGDFKEPAALEAV